MKIVKDIMITIKKVLLTVYSELLKVAKIVGSFILKILSYIKIFFVLLYKKVLIYPIMFFVNASRMVFIGLETIFRPVINFLVLLVKKSKPLFKLIYLFFRKIFLILYKIVSGIFRIIYLFFKLVLEKIKLFLVKFYSTIKKIMFFIKKVFKRTFAELSYGIKMVFINMSLLIIFFLYEIPKFIIVEIIWKTVYFFYKGIEKIIIYIIKLSKKFFKLLSPIYKFIINIFVSFVDFIKSYSHNYYIVLLFPLTVLVFIILSVITIIYTIYIYISMLLKTILNVEIKLENRVYKINKYYDIRINLSYNTKTIIRNNKFYYEFAKGIKVLGYSLFIFYFLIISFVFNLMINILISPISLVLYLKNRNRKKDLEKRIIFLERSNGLIANQTYKFYRNEVKIIKNTIGIYDEYLDLYVLSTINKQTITVAINEKNVDLTKEISYSSQALLLLRFYEIKNYLTTQTRNEFNLISYDNVNYEVIKQTDKIRNNKYFMMNNYSNDTKIRVNIVLDRNSLSRSVKLIKVINKKKLTNKFSNKIFYTSKGTNLKKLLNLNYEIIFFKTDQIDENGNLTISEDGFYDFRFYTFEDKNIYQVKTFYKVSENILKKYENNITKVKIDVNEKKIIYDEKIKETNKKINLFIDNNLIESNYQYDQVINDSIFKRYFNITISFLFNNKLVTKKYKIINVNHNISKINEHYVEKIKNELENSKSDYKFPFIINKKLKFINVRSLNTKYITSLGYIKTNKKVKVSLKITLYYSLFVRSSVVVEVILSGNEE